MSRHWLALSWNNGSGLQRHGHFWLPSDPSDQVKCPQMRRGCGPKLRERRTWPKTPSPNPAHFRIARRKRWAIHDPWRKPPVA